MPKEAAGGCNLAVLLAQAYFFGYMIHRLLLVATGRRGEDDRDHYANKRLDLGGPLLANLFRMLFRKLARDARGYVQRCVDKGRDVNLPAGINKDTITKGLRYSLATGNWGMMGTAGLRAGVSQVIHQPVQYWSQLKARHVCCSKIWDCLKVKVPTSCCH